MRDAWLLATMTLTLALIAPAAASATTLFGFDDLSVTGAQTSATQSATYQSEGGANAGRVIINWDWIQPTDTTPNFSTYDAIYNADLARGIKPVFDITGAPPWAWATGTICVPGDDCNYPPGTDHNADWSNIVTDIAQRYPLLAGIAVWEEPNEDWSWVSGPDPARYTQLLQLADNAVKAVSPSTPVIGGDLSTDMNTSITAGLDGAYPMQLFLAGMYQAGAKGYMNALAIHPYPNALSDWYVSKAINLTEDVRDQNGDGSDPIWITETGMSTTNGFSKTTQSEMFYNLVPTLTTEPGINAVFINQLADTTTGPQVNKGFGVMTTSFAPKPAFCQIADIRGTGFKCPLLTNVPTPSSTQEKEWNAQDVLEWASSEALAYRNAHGSYTGLTSAILHAGDSRISATPANGNAAGSGSNPGQVGIFPVGSAGSGILICNQSQAGLSYCVLNAQPGAWAYGNATGTIYQAAHAVIYGSSQTW